jgi:hypothetical protein
MWSPPVSQFPMGDTSATATAGSSSYHALRRGPAAVWDGLPLRARRRELSGLLEAALKSLEYLRGAVEPLALPLSPTEYACAPRTVLLLACEVFVELLSPSLWTLIPPRGVLLPVSCGSSAEPSSPLLWAPRSWGAVPASSSSLLLVTGPSSELLPSMTAAGEATRPPRLRNVEDDVAVVVAMRWGKTT